MYYKLCIIEENMRDDNKGRTGRTLKEEEERKRKNEGKVKDGAWARKDKRKYK